MVQFNLNPRVLQIKGKLSGEAAGIWKMEGQPPGLPASSG